MSLPLRVVGDRVLIKPDLDDHAVTATDSGLLVADTLEAAVTGQDVAPSYVSGTVVAMGDQDALFDVRPYVLRRLREAPVLDLPLTLIRDIEALPTHRPCDFALGDRVTFSWKSGQDVEIDGEAYVIMKTTDVLAVLQETA